MTGNKQVKAFISFALTTCFCFYTILSVQKLHRQELVDAKMISKPGANTARLQVPASPQTGSKHQSPRRQVFLAQASGKESPWDNNNVSGSDRQLHNLTMTKLDFQLRKHLLRNKEEKYLSYFRPRFQDRQTYLMVQIMRTFDRIVSENGIAYFLYGGALIGSFRHHGLIPWDDDADVMVSFTHRMRLHRLLKAVGTEVTVSFHPVHYWKLYHPAGDVIEGVPWKWPFLDIFFYDHNSTHVWDIAPQYKEEFTFPKNAIFPLRRRPFMGMYLPGPKDPQTVLARGYNISECTSGGYVHRWERVTHSMSVPCSWLSHVFPFVERVDMNGGCNETLRYKSKIVGVFFDWGVRCKNSEVLI